MATRSAVYAALDSERAYQAFRWGEQKHELESFLLYMDDYLTRLKTVVSGADPTYKDHDSIYSEAIHRIRKITALGVAAMEQHGAPQRAGFECDIPH